MISNFSFEYPYFILLFVLFLVCEKYCKSSENSYYMPHINLYEKSISTSLKLKQILKSIAVFFAILALCSPIKIIDTQNTNVDGIDIILALDTSASMKQKGFDAQDTNKTRWEVVQHTVSSFIKKRENDNIGLVVFGTTTMIASALSYDKNAQRKIIKNLQIGMAGNKTALLDALATSIYILKNRKSKSKIVVVLTDGDDTSSKIPFAVVKNMALKYGIKIYSIGISDTSTDTLQQISKATNGQYFKATSKDNLNSVYQTINKLEKSKIKQNKIIVKHHYFGTLLFISILVFLFYILLQNKSAWFRR